MNTDVPPAVAPLALPRGGFWRRWLATVIDTIIIMLPFQILAAILFSVTAGMVQMDSGFFTVCTVSKDIPQVQFDPRPPHDSNFSRTCRISFFGPTTGAILTVGRVTREGAMTTTVSQGYMLDKAGNPIRGYSIDWIVWLTLLVYLVAMIRKSGRTLGDRATRLMVIDTASPNAAGVPLGKAFIRYLAMAIGFVPMLAILLYQRVAVGGTADEIFTVSFFHWFMAAGVLAIVWCILLIVQVARKRDPYYDRLGGTAVVRI